MIDYIKQRIALDMAFLSEHWMIMLLVVTGTFISVFLITVFLGYLSDYKKKRKQ